MVLPGTCRVIRKPSLDCPQSLADQGIKCLPDFYKLVGVEHLQEAFFILIFECHVNGVLLIQTHFTQVFDGCLELLFLKLVLTLDKLVFLTYLKVFLPNVEVLSDR